MAEVFNFCPTSQVPETLPRELDTVLTMNGWQFTAKPTTPYQRKFRLKLFGLRWILDPVSGLYDSLTTPEINARTLELFYERHEMWLPFDWTHQHLGLMSCRFAAPIVVPAAPQGNNGLIEPLEVTLIHHNPGFA